MNIRKNHVSRLIAAADAILGEHQRVALPLTEARHTPEGSLSVKVVGMNGCRRVFQDIQSSENRIKDAEVRWYSLHDCYLPLVLRLQHQPINCIYFANEIETDRKSTRL